MTRILPQHALGGMQKQTMDLCEGFVKSGHRVTIFTTKRNDGSNKSTFRIKGLYLIERYDEKTMVQVERNAKRCKHSL